MTATDELCRLLDKLDKIADDEFEAAFGRGECRIKPWRMEPDTGFFDCMECDSCGHVMDVSEWSRANYCPSCGRRVANG